MTSTDSNDGVTLPDYVIELINNIGELEGFTEFSIPSNSILRLISGYSGSVLRTTIKGRRNDNDDELNLIIKVPLESDDDYYSRAIFGKEIHMYKVVLPAFEKFQNDKGLTAETGFYDFPKCYGTISDIEQKRYAIILEDLNDRNYETWKKENYLDMNHTKLILKRLGKFNAISLAMRDQVPNVFAPFERIQDNLIAHWNNDIATDFQKSILDIISKNLDPCETEAIAKLTATKTRFYEEFVECVGENVAGQFGVITHGDLWSNNTMFVYKDAIPQSACIIDWQNIRFGSPALDLLFYIFVSTDKKLRYAHYEDMLNIYYEAVEKTLTLVGSDAKKLFTFEDFSNQLKKFGKFVVLKGPINIQLMCTTPADLPNFGEWATNLDEGCIIPVSKKAKDEFYIKIKEVIGEIIALGYY